MNNLEKELEKGITIENEIAYLKTSKSEID